MVPMCISMSNIFISDLNLLVKLRLWHLTLSNKSRFHTTSLSGMPTPVEQRLTGTHQQPDSKYERRLVSKTSLIKNELHTVILGLTIQISVNTFHISFLHSIQEASLVGLLLERVVK